MKKYLRNLVIITLLTLIIGVSMSQPCFAADDDIPRITISPKEGTN